MVGKIVNESALYTAVTIKKGSYTKGIIPFV